MDDISTSTLFAANGALAEINLDEWMGGWVSIVGGVHGRPTAQQFNKAFNALQKMILANQRSIQSADKKADDAVPAKSFNKETIISKIADGTLIEKLNAGMLGGHTADYFAPATAAFCRYTDYLSGNTHQFTGNGNSHGYVYMDSSYSSGQKITVNGKACSVYAGGDLVDEIAGGHWYAFTYDQERGMIDFFGMGTQKYMKKEGGKFTGVVSFGSNNNYVNTAGDVYMNTLTCRGNISGNKTYHPIYNDYAELFPRGESTEPGDIIALDERSDREQYIKATYGDHVVGVHSDEFGQLIGGDAPPDGFDYFEWNIGRFIPVGLIGRCRVKVIGRVRKGDYIVPSEKYPGVGVAVSDPAQAALAVGFAVENSNESGIRRVRVRLGR